MNAFYPMMVTIILTSWGRIFVVEFLIISFLHKLKEISFYLIFGKAGCSSYFLDIK